MPEQSIVDAAAVIREKAHSHLAGEYNRDRLHDITYRFAFELLPHLLLRADTDSHKWVGICSDADQFRQIYIKVCLESGVRFSPEEIDEIQTWREDAEGRFVVLLAYPKPPPIGASDLLGPYFSAVWWQQADEMPQYFVVSQAVVAEGEPPAATVRHFSSATSHSPVGRLHEITVESVRTFLSKDVASR